MTPFDIIILALILLFIARGVWVGLIGQLAFLAALILGYAAAGAYYSRLGHLLLPLIPNPQANFLITYIILFVVTYLLTILVGMGLKKVMSITLLGWFDRLMGGLFGLAKAAFLSTLLFMALSGFISGQRPFYSHSLSTPYLTASSNYLLTWIRDNDLRHRLVPKQPAISVLLAPPAVPAGKTGGGNPEKKTK